MDNLEVLHQRYARALFDFAGKASAADEIMRNLESLTAIIRTSPDIRRMLKHPEISRDEKLKVLKAISKKNGFCEAFMDFLKVLIRKNRLNIIHGVFLRYRDYYDEERKRAKVLIMSAVKLKQDQINKLSEHLSSRLKKQVILDIKIDPSLIGGFYLKLRDRIYDASIAEMLSSINKGLAG